MTDIPQYVQDNYRQLAAERGVSFAQLARDLANSGDPALVAWLNEQDQPAPAAEPVVTVSPDAVPAAAEAPQA